MLNQWSASRTVNRKDCLLAEHCCTAKELQQHVTEDQYHSIILNNNSLDDKDLQHLYQLSYLEHLSIADVDINGSCLAGLLKISGLRSLDISYNTYLDHNLMLKNLFEYMPTGSLEKLDVSENLFDYLTLRQLITLAFYCANKGFKQLILGDLDYLSKKEIGLLSMLINEFKVHYPGVVVESSTLNNYLTRKRHTSSCAMEAMKGF